MRIRIILVVLFLGFSLYFTSSDLARMGSPQDLNGNSCVTCHSQIKDPLKLSAKYFEWHSSFHRDKGVTCDKCHGGDPASADRVKAHKGILSSGNPAGKTNYRLLPTTCGSCHKGLVDSFKQSRHYAALKETSLGPSCSTCHGHMASEVVISAQQTATMCAFCHNTVNGLLRPSPGITEQAETAIESINRADVAVGWASSLLREADTKKAYIPTERMEVVAAQGTLKEAKLTWHTYDLRSTIRKADEAYQAAMKAKDDLNKKLGH